MRVSEPKRLFTAACLMITVVAVCLITASAGPTGVAYAAGGGNSSAASLCQKGGYAHLMRTDGSKFKNTGDCVSYSAKGGKLVPIPATLVLTEPISITTPQCWAGVTTAGVTPIEPALWNSGTYGHAGASLCFQSDGNLVIYEDGYVGDPLHALWNTGTFGYPDAFLNFQTDGNLVIYSNGRPLWNSTTSGHAGDCVIFQGDGNLVIYTGCTTTP